MLVCVPYNAGYNLLSMLLKFTHMQAEVMKLVMDVELVPAIYMHKLKSSLYNGASFLLFMFRCQVDVNSSFLLVELSFVSYPAS